MKSKKRSDEIQMEFYPDGKLGIILSKDVGDKFNEVFKGQAVNVFAGIAEKARKMIIEVTVAHVQYII